MKLFSLLLWTLFLNNPQNLFSFPLDNVPKPLLFTGAVFTRFCRGTLLFNMIAHNASPSRSTGKIRFLLQSNKTDLTIRGCNCKILYRTSRVLGNLDRVTRSFRLTIK